MHPEYLKTSEPQMMIEMCCLTHNHIAFKGTLAPGLRAASERSEVLTNGQSQPSTHDLSLESPDQVGVLKHLEVMVEIMEHEPALRGYDGNYAQSAEPVDQESNVSNEQLEQEDRREIGHTSSPYPSK